MAAPFPWGDCGSWTGGTWWRSTSWRGDWKAKD
jgi:hypothetical protein